MESFGSKTLHLFILKKKKDLLNLKKRPGTVELIIELN